jgi:hypothetical protein
MRHRRRRGGRKSETTDETFEKAQLHGDSIPKKPVYEKQSNNVCEMMGSLPAIAEKPANEPPANELDANKKGQGSCET